ncbi:hypothetical protein KR018_005467 [Drosophila ironensis]|nr:hypothetical protein KR018_005467 [Drosophila ironensis]
MLPKPHTKLCHTIQMHRRGVSTSPAAGQSFRKWYQGLWRTERTNLPPYSHFTQIGDPVLRQRAAPVPPEHLDSPEVQAVVERMVRVLRKFDCVGIAAPQIGVSLRIIAMEFKKSLRKELPEALYQARQMSELPLTVGTLLQWQMAAELIEFPPLLQVLINPVLTVSDYTKLKHPEGCMSVRGFSAEVERYAGVQLTGADGQSAAGGEFNLELSGWNARIAQHEMDHLEGKLYTDHMDRATFACTCWEAVNTKSGRVEIPFYK